MNRLPLRLATVLALAAAPAAAQVTILQDSTLELRVVGTAGALEVPATGVAVRQLFRVLAGTSALLRLTPHLIPVTEAAMILNDRASNLPASAVVWRSGDSTAVRVTATAGEDGSYWARVDAVGPPGSGARVYATLTVPRLSGPEVDFALYWEYISPAMRCNRLVVPPFTTAAGTWTMTKVSAFEDQLKGLSCWSPTGD